MTGEDLKAFAQRFYGRPGVEPLLLDCQDRLGLDVLCLLGACWLGGQGRILRQAEWQQVLVGQRRWQQDVIAPLRRARRALKPLAEAELLYPQLKQCELSAEWLALEHLQRALERQPAASKPIATAVGVNLECYAEQAGCDRLATQELLGELARLAQGASITNPG